MLRQFACQLIAAARGVEDVMLRVVMEMFTLFIEERNAEAAAALCGRLHRVQRKIPAMAQTNAVYVEEFRHVAREYGAFSEKETPVEAICRRRSNNPRWRRGLRTLSM